MRQAKADDGHVGDDGYPGDWQGLGNAGNDRRQEDGEHMPAGNGDGRRAQRSEQEEPNPDDQRPDEAFVINFC